MSSPGHPAAAPFTVELPSWRRDALRRSRSGRPPPGRPDTWLRGRDVGVRGDTGRGAAAAIDGDREIARCEALQ